MSDSCTVENSFLSITIRRYLVFIVPILLMNNFTLYMIASEKANHSLICSVKGGVLNMVLDYPATLEERSICFTVFRYFVIFLQKLI